jgi:hypothetical protein
LRLVATSIPKLVRQAPATLGIVGKLLDPDQLAAASAGREVITHHSSRVRRLAIDGQETFVKTYLYETWRSRFRDLGKRTAPWARSRAAREFDALIWLRQHDLGAPAPLAVFEWRRLGFLTQATLLTAAIPGTPADVLLAALPPAEREELAAAVSSYLHAAHCRGFRDRNFDLRNLIVARDGGAFVVSKLDSPRYVLVRAGPPNDALARADWARLQPQLAAFGVAAAAPPPLNPARPDRRP